MNILMVNKFYYIKGGSETYYFSLKNLLEKNGHKIIDFSMNHSDNLPSKYSAYFVKNVDYNGKHNILKKAYMGLKIIYSFEAKRKINKLIKNQSIDIAHLHIFQHQISPSIISVLKKHKIPIVYTAHDLKMICPNYKMLCHGKICEECKGSKYIKCTINKCVKDSFIKSLINTVEAYFHKMIGSYQAIDYIITPSKFYQDKFIEFGINANRIYHIPNFLNTECIKLMESKDKDYYLYFGRLSEEKGVWTLIKAFENIDQKLYIIGTGPMENDIIDYLKNSNIANIYALGFKQSRELYDYIGNAKAIVIPSEWYENGPYTVIESMKIGKPIIGSNMGGIPEMIEVGENGFIFSAGSVMQLKECVLKLEQLTLDQYNQMCKKSREIFYKYYTDSQHYNEIMHIYKKAIDQN